MVKTFDCFPHEMTSAVSNECSSNKQDQLNSKFHFEYQSCSNTSTTNFFQKKWNGFDNFASSRICWGDKSKPNALRFQKAKNLKSQFFSKSSDTIVPNGKLSPSPNRITQGCFCFDIKQRMENLKQLFYCGHFLKFIVQSQKELIITRRPQSTGIFSALFAFTN